MGAPASIASNMYWQWALPTLLYVAQLTTPPGDLEIMERQTISKIPRLPGSTLGRRWHLELARWGGGAMFGSALAQMQAAPCRAAISTFRWWLVACSELPVSMAHRRNTPVGSGGRVGGTRVRSTCTLPKPAAPKKLAA